MGIWDTNFLSDGLWTSISWRAPLFKKGELGGIPFLAEMPSERKLNGLPTEFFNHELKDVDSSDGDQIARFCSEWGILCSPCFGSYDRLSESSKKQRSATERRHEERQLVHRSRIRAALAILGDALNADEGSRLAAMTRAIGVLRGRKDPVNGWKDYSDFQKLELGAILADAGGGAYRPCNRLETGFLSDEREAVMKSLYLQTEFSQADVQEALADARDMHPVNVISLDEARCVLEKLQDIAHIFPIMDSYESTNEILFAIAKLIAVDKAAIHSEALHQVAARVVEANGGALPAELGDADFRFDESSDPLPGLNAWAASAVRYFEECISPIYRNALRSRNPEFLPGFDNQGPFSLTNAICIQLYFELGDGSDWRRCSYSKCDRFFKYQRSTPLPHYYQERRKSGALYCCKNHGIYASRQLVLEAQKTANRMAANGHTKHEIGLFVATNYQGLTSSQSEKVIEKALSSSSKRPRQRDADGPA